MEADLSVDPGITPTQECFSEVLHLILVHNEVKNYWTGDSTSVNEPNTHGLL